MPTKADKSEATQTRIIAAAREVFARDGYAKAPLAEIVREAEITTGAIYHHFHDKKGLFEAVAKNVEQQILDEVVAKVGDVATGFSALESGLVATLEICVEPDIQQIIFRDAPAVFGLREWRKIEMQYALGLMQGTISNLSRKGEINSGDSQMTAQIILGAIIEAAQAVADADGDQAALQRAKQTVLTMVRALAR